MGHCEPVADIMSGKALGSVIRRGDQATKSITRGLLIQRRTFTNSSTRQKHGVIPEFTKTTSPELDSHLAYVRENLIMPAHLQTDQQNLIYKKKYEKNLEGGAVKATIRDEEFTLKHIDKTKDIPRGQRALHSALKLMKENGHWDNLPNLIQGLRSAGAKIEPFYRTQVMRFLGRAGRQDLIIECLRRVSNTGMNLNDNTTLQQALWWMQFKGLMSEWDREQTSKALSWAEMIMEMLEEPKHHASGGGISPNRDRPENNGILLQLAAVRAEKHWGGEDTDGKVELWARKLLSGYSKWNIDIQGPKRKKASQSNEWVCELVPVLHGVKVAQRVLNPSSKLVAPLEQIEVDIEKLLPPLLKSAERHIANFPDNGTFRPHGLWLYKALLSPESS